MERFTATVFCVSSPGFDPTEADEALARLRDYVPPARSEASPGAEMTGALSLPVRP